MTVRRSLFGVVAALIALALIIPPASADARVRKVVLGVSIEHHNREPGTFDQFKRQVGGNAPRMWTLWSQWGSPNTKQFPRYAADWVAQKGAVPFIFWEPIDPAGSCMYSKHAWTARGDYDTYIREWAKAARAYGEPVMLRWAHEINGQFFRWGTRHPQCGNTIADYKAAWKHIVKIFRSVKANNVKFVWTVARARCPGGCNPYDDYYPGNKFVHYVGFSNFNWGAVKNTWTPMDEGIGEVMAQFKKFTKKPVIVAELASNTQPPSGAPPSATKPNWIKSGYPKVYKKFPQIKAIVYLNVDLSHIGHPDWSLNSPGPYTSADRSASHRAYEVIADMARFRGRFR
jgi:hypothetical protein